MNPIDDDPPSPGDTRPDTAVRIGPLVELLELQDARMRSLFAKALNLYVSPGAEALPEREKLDRLKKAIEESLNQSGTPC